MPQRQRVRVLVERIRKRLSGILRRKKKNRNPQTGTSDLPPNSNEHAEPYTQEVPIIIEPDSAAPAAPAAAAAAATAEDGELAQHGAQHGRQDDIPVVRGSSTPPNLEQVPSHELGTARRSELAPNLNDVRIARMAPNELREAVGTDPADPEPELGHPIQPFSTAGDAASSMYSSVPDSDDERLDAVRRHQQQAAGGQDEIKPLNINRESQIQSHQDNPYLSTHLGVPSRTHAYHIQGPDGAGVQRNSALSRTFDIGDLPENHDVDETVTENMRR